MELSVFDLSKYLGVVPDTIERWVRQGKLPVSQKGAKYKFQQVELEKWAVKHNISMNSLDKKISEKEKESVIPLSVAVQNGGVYVDVPGNNVNSVLTAAIEKFTNIPEDTRAQLLERLIERESALSTGIGKGIAIPHPREQLTDIPCPMVCICFLEHPVDYKAIDNQPESVLFFLLCPSLKLHLHLLSALSFCLRDGQFTSFLKSKPDPIQLIEKIETLQKANPI